MPNMMPKRRSLRRDLRGNVAMIVALATVPVVGCIGLAVDAGSALRRQERLQAAVDSGVLAGLKAMPYQNDQGVTDAANRYIQTNFGGLPYELTEVDIDRTNSRVEISAKSENRTMFGGIFGIRKIDVSANAIAAGGGTIELVMVLDNSGSMAQSGRIQALREASTDLVDTLMDDAALAGRISIGVVPFSTAVNVGPQNATQSWIDRSGRSPLHGENFSPRNTNRFTLFNRLNTAWEGCVEARTSQNNLDVSDATPKSGDGRTLFVPMFAPDNSDTPYYINGSDHYNGTNGLPSRPLLVNDYLNDNGGTCSPISASATQTERQERRCKYEGQTPRTVHLTYGTYYKIGPNAMCNSIPLLTLTSTKAPVTSKLDAMVPAGNTNIVEGTSWGLRVLSPGAPFTNGHPYGRTGNRKIMIVMTDGENTMSATDQISNTNVRNANMGTFYSAYGYPHRGRLVNPPSFNDATHKTAMDNRLRVACQIAKDQDIEVFSILLSVPSDAARNVMRDCATQGGPDQHFFDVQTSGELGNVFEQIGRTIKQVRLAE